MDTYTLVVVIICMILYTIFAIWQISRFDQLKEGVLGTIAIMIGGTGLYFFVAPIIAVIILWLLKLLFIIAIVGILISIFIG